MDATELLAARAEDGTYQFKVNVHKAKSLGQEFAAFANSGGGTVLLGVTDDGQVPGLTTPDIARLNQVVSNAASECVRPPTVSLVHIADGGQQAVLGHGRQCLDQIGCRQAKRYFARVAAAHVSSAGLVDADETPTKGGSVADLDLDYFGRFFEFRKRPGWQPVPRHHRSPAPARVSHADTMDATCYALLSDSNQLRYGVWGRSTVTAISVERDNAASPVQNSVAPDSSAVAR